MIIGKEKPDSGSITIGDTVKFSYVDQTRTLDPEKTVYEEISGGAENLELGKRKVNARGYVSSFNFAGTDQQKKVGILSGGERNRVHLAKTLTEGANVLLLDEPTNDLDVNTLRALEEALTEFAGVALVVSHDRWFLDRICTHLGCVRGRFHCENVHRQLVRLRNDDAREIRERFNSASSEVSNVETLACQPTCSRKSPNSKRTNALSSAVKRDLFGWERGALKRRAITRACAGQVNSP
jgi:sulfate-transporting ATPase